MDYSKKQKQLDVKKWVDSELKGYDTCGEYDYCSSCSKSEAYPCAYAYEIYNEIVKLAKVSNTTTKKATAKSTAKAATTTKATTAKSSTAKKATTTKSSTCKSTAAKKTTAKKSTTSTKKTSKVVAEVC